MIYGLVGYARAGKDTVAKFVCQEKSCARRAFADALKREVSDNLYHAVNQRIHFSDDKEKIRFRNLLVAWGEAVRELDPERWINLCFNEMSLRGNFIITDVRYLNEAKVIKKTGGKLIYIDRPKFGAANETEARTIKEILDSGLIDYTILNNGSLNELKKKAIDVIQFM